ncbi:MAG: hypothetical protein OXH00_13440 [Candidatus Poribacteria bacterium]|nr:hypothetical protein [Candidatus Poribacteria bacterium]
MKIRFVSILLTLLLASFSEAEVLHKWFESNPDHSYTYAGTDEDLFNTYTTKDASRSESEGSWQVTASATASANAQAPLPRSCHCQRKPLSSKWTHACPCCVLNCDFSDGYDAHDKRTHHKQLKKVDEKTENQIVLRPCRKTLWICQNCDRIDAGILAIWTHALHFNKFKN